MLLLCQIGGVKVSLMSGPLQVTGLQDQNIDLLSNVVFVQPCEAQILYFSGQKAWGARSSTRQF